MYPMVLLSIISAIAQVADIRRLRKVGGLFVLYVFVGSAVACLFGILSFSIIRPGAGLHWQIENAAEASTETGSIGSTLVENIVGWVPSNPFEALSTGALVQIVFFAVFFGVILSIIRDSNSKAKLALDCIEGINSVILTMINAVLQIAPIGICAMVANMVGNSGIETLGAVGGFMLAYYVGIIAFFFIFLMAVIKFGCGLSPIRYLKNVFPVVLTALSTLSSAGTIPVTNRASKVNIGVPSDIADLLTAPAATINMNGAALEFTAYIMFASFLYDVKLSIPQMLFAIVLGVVSSIGSAGVPGGGIIMGTICMGIMGFPDEVVVLVAGVYTVLDFGATLANILGDTVGMTWISSKLGELDKDTFYAENVM